MARTVASDPSRESPDGAIGATCAARSRTKERWRFGTFPLGRCRVQAALQLIEFDLGRNQAFVLNLLTTWDIRMFKKPIEEYTGPGPLVECVAGGKPAPGTDRLILPPAHQTRLLTSNAVERVNRELKHRTRVARLFPNDASLVRFISALAVEISDDWEAGKIYLDMTSLTHPPG